MKFCLWKGRKSIFDGQQETGAGCSDSQGGSSERSVGRESTDQAGDNNGLQRGRVMKEERSEREEGRKNGSGKRPKVITSGRW
jgi:hypothetical protein